MAASRPELQPGTFWSHVEKCSQRALQSGALQPIATNANVVEDQGVEFVIRVADNLARKQNLPSAYHQPDRLNPFLPPDHGLTVGTLAPNHIAVLNKFNVLERHVLIVTRGFIHQEAPLSVADFAAVAAGLAGGGSLAFYNAGQIAGASQAHKHFQLVPLPLTSNQNQGPDENRSADVPMAVLFKDADCGINTIRRLGFRHWFSWLDAEPAQALVFGRACYRAYARALHELGIADELNDSTTSRLPPYNLLVTRRWLFLAPRRAEHYRKISVNGLGYGGSLFVSSIEKLEQVRSAGPMAVLDAVSLSLD